MVCSNLPGAPAPSPASVAMLDANGVIHTKSTQPTLGHSPWSDPLSDPLSRIPNSTKDPTKDSTKVQKPRLCQCYVVRFSPAATPWVYRPKKTFRALKARFIVLLPDEPVVTRQAERRAQTPEGWPENSPGQASQRAPPSGYRPPPVRSPSALRKGRGSG
jgi:hypothetical protein